MLRVRFAPHLFPSSHSTCPFALSVCTASAKGVCYARMASHAFVRPRMLYPCMMYLHVMYPCMMYLCMTAVVRPRGRDNNNAEVEYAERTGASQPD